MLLSKYKELISVIIITFVIVLLVVMSMYAIDEAEGSKAVICDDNFCAGSRAELSYIHKQEMARR